MIIINGTNYKGNCIGINNGNIIINGKNINTDDEKEININVEGNLDSLNVDYCNRLSVKGDVGNLETGSGDPKISGNVNGSIRTGSGDVQCGNVSGNIRTGSGDVCHN